MKVGVLGSGVVGQLVASQAGPPEPLIGALIHRRAAVFVLGRCGRRSPATRSRAYGQVVTVERGQTVDFGVLERQQVDRQVVGLQGQGHVQGRIPGPERLTRDVGEQVHAQRGEPGAHGAG